MDASAFETHRRFKNTGALPAPSAFKRHKMRQFYSGTILAAAGLNSVFLSDQTVDCLANIAMWRQAVERMQLQTADAVVAFYHLHDRLPRPSGREFRLNMFMQRMARRWAHLEHGMLFESTLETLNGIQWLERMDDAHHEQARELLEYFELNHRLP
jgi:hypothetical protein